MSAIELLTADRVRIVGDLAVPHEPRAAAIVCHPHPLYGGDRHNHVVQTLFDALPAAGIAALRFDFRREFGGGVAEVADAQAAIGHLRSAVPGVPVVATGYSFGASVVLGLDDADIAARILVAPPLAATGAGAPRRAVPTLLLVPAHDQFSDPAATAAVVAAWPTDQPASTSTEAAHIATTEIVTIEMADHALLGRTHVVAEHAVGWLRARLARPHS